MSCNFPFIIENPGHTGFFSIPVPCGKCYDCRIKMIQQWCFRMIQHDKYSKLSYFVTLTYDTDNVPITKKGLMTLDNGNHFKNYIKRIRNRYRYRKIDTKTKRMRYYYDKVPSIKYFMVGEYGSKKKRPHYHAIIFNCSEEDIIQEWKYGDVHIGNVSGNSIAYTLKYMFKDSKIPLWNGDDRIPEYRRCSQKLGVQYLTENVINYHRSRPKDLYLESNGHKLSMPRYYRQKIWSEDELKKINAQNLHNMEKIQSLAEQNFNHTHKNTKNYVERKRANSQHKADLHTKNQNEKRGF